MAATAAPPPAPTAHPPASRGPPAATGRGVVTSNDYQAPRPTPAARPRPPPTGAEWARCEDLRRPVGCPGCQSEGRHGRVDQSLDQSPRGGRGGAGGARGSAGWPAGGTLCPGRWRSSGNARIPGSRGLRLLRSRHQMSRHDLGPGSADSDLQAKSGPLPVFHGPQAENFKIPFKWLKKK